MVLEYVHPLQEAFTLCNENHYEISFPNKVSNRGHCNANHYTISTSVVCLFTITLTNKRSVMLLLHIIDNK